MICGSQAIFRILLLRISHREGTYLRQALSPSQGLRTFCLVICCRWSSRQTGGGRKIRKASAVDFAWPTLRGNPDSTGACQHARFSRAHRTTSVLANVIRASRLPWSTNAFHWCIVCGYRYPTPLIREAIGRFTVWVGWGHGGRGGASLKCRDLLGISYNFKRFP